MGTGWRMPTCFRIIHIYQTLEKISLFVLSSSKLGTYIYLRYLHCSWYLFLWWTFKVGSTKSVNPKTVFKLPGKRKCQKKNPLNSTNYVHVLNIHVDSRKRIQLPWTPLSVVAIICSKSLRGVSLRIFHPILSSHWLEVAELNCPIALQQYHPLCVKTCPLSGESSYSFWLGYHGLVIYGDGRRLEGYWQ